MRLGIQSFTALLDISAIQDVLMTRGDKESARFRIVFNSLPRLAAFAVLSSAALQGPLFGQSTYSPPLLQAVQPFQSYDGGDLDSVNLATGMLSLHIPIVSFPQRGALHLDYSVGYTNPSATPVLASTPAGVFGHYSIIPAGLVFANDAFPIAEYTAKPLPCAGCTSYELTLIDGTGTGHPLEFINAGSQARTVDGSGYLVNSPLAKTCTITDRRGITTVWGGNVATTTDANGNQMTETSADGFGCFSSLGASLSPTYISAGAITDTVGRQIPAISNIWTVPGPNGGTSTYQITSSGSTQSLVLPDHAAFIFNFVTIQLPLLARQTIAQTLTLLQSITLPNGGTISYGYGPSSPIGATAPITSRTVDAKDGTGPHTWTYQYSDSYNSSTQLTSIITTVTDPVGDMSVHTFPLLQALTTTTTSTPFETKIQEEDPAGNVLKTTMKSYGVRPINDGGGPNNVNANPASITTIWPNGQQSTVSMTYDVDNGSGFVAGIYEVGPSEPGFVPNSVSSSYTLNPWSMSETDYGNGASGSVLRTTNTSYLAFSSPPYLANNLLDLPYSVQIEDGGGNQRSYTTYGYDEVSLQSSGVTEQKGAGKPYAGNQTSIHRWLSNGSAVSQPSCNVSVTSGNYLVINYTYFDTGEVQQQTDPCLHSTSYLYSSSYFGAYPTTVTNPLGQKNIYSYDFNTGSLLSATDPNSNTTMNSYDIMGRLAGIAYPDGGSTSNCYTDLGGATCTQASSPPYSVVTSQALSSSVSKASTSTFDGLGRVMTTQLNSDSAGVSTVKTTYDTLGRVRSVSNPYRSTSDPTYGTTTYAYDALGRMTVQTQPDGSLVQLCYNGVNSGQASYVCLPNASSMTSGSWVDYSDELNRHGQRVSDALGRLTAVMEPVANIPTLETDYGYDPLGNLLSVNQKGTSGETPRTRSFTHDSLSRLLAASNPETGTICYGTWSGGSPGSGSCHNGYDANGNLVTKTDARGVTVSYGYDALNRLTSKTYSGGSGATTASSCYQYDTSSSGGANLIGRLTAEWTQFGSCPSAPSPSGQLTRHSILAYDSMGRVLSEQQCHLSKCASGTPYHNTMSYDLAGNPTFYANGFHSIALTSFYDAAGRLTNVNSSLVGPSYPANIFSVGSYTPSGDLQTFTLGTNINVTRSYDSRLRPAGETATHP